MREKVEAGKETRLDNSVAFDFIREGDELIVLGGEMSSNTGDGVRMFLEKGDEWAFRLYFPELLEELSQATATKTKPRKRGKKKVA